MMRYINTANHAHIYKPVFTPSRLVVKYGDPASVICNACQQECLNEFFNLEYSVGKSTKTGTTISWNIDNFTDWTASLQCYYNKAAENVSDPDVQCCTILPLTVYKPPDKVSISFANHTGPLIEAHPYTLQCTVHNVAPVEKVMAIFYRGHSVVGQVQVNNSYGGKPMTHSYTLDVTPHKGEDGAAYWCAAELVLGPEGPHSLSSTVILSFQGNRFKHTLYVSSKRRKSSPLVHVVSLTGISRSRRCRKQPDHLGYLQSLVISKLSVTVLISPSHHQRPSQVAVCVRFNLQ
uniref:Ig-like domain-containing protein n=1 Tax=Labrus bergylta TaxID=56723 RepID=A0A3Q3E578_9LABR